ncbi:MAG: zinc-dependent metalloprotease [Parvularculaceae bacterium]
MRKFALAALILVSSCTVDRTDGTGGRTYAFGGAGDIMDVDANADGKVYIRLQKPNRDGVSLRVIHAVGLTAGLGSNPVGLDRGFSDDGSIISFRRYGDRVVIMEENTGYRADTSNEDEKKAVQQSFASSILWTGKAEDEKPDGTYAVDISSFLTADTLNITGILEAGGQTGYKLAAERSFVDAGSAKSFPDNTEIDAYMTFSADKAGGEVAATAANGLTFTLIQHHSFVRLPEDGFKTRDFDPRTGDIDVGFYDFAAPLDKPIIHRYARRFRLERKDADAASGPVKKPIIFYVDRGAPEPIRSALVEGASWWADAFKAAGFEDAYKVELLPEGADPMDVRYNVIQWVHRQTRGWSYGGGIADPRTGEMIKAHVVLGSQRVRQDRMIFEGLAGASKTGTGEADDPVQLSLGRIRQLAAHEVGHTLGFAHNFAASTNDRASVMDYPAPWVRPAAGGKLDFSKAYDVGIGEWDKVTVNWLYSEYPDGTDEKAALNKIIEDAYAKGLRFVDDNEARGLGTGEPFGAVWDNGADPVAALNETMRVRQIALSNFGPNVLTGSSPVSDLRSVLVPIYLYHRYEVAAAAKSIGGYEFRYALKGDPKSAGAPVAADRQRAALAAVLATLDPAALDLPDGTLNLLNPPIAAFDGGSGKSEHFDNDTGAMFDLLSAADAAATESLSALLHPARAARLIETERRDPQSLTFDNVLSAIEGKLFAPAANPRRAEIKRREQERYVSMLIGIASGGASSNSSQAPSLFVNFGPGATASPAVMARTNAYLEALAKRLAASPRAFAPPAVPNETDENGETAPVATPVRASSADLATRAELIRRINAHLAAPAPAITPTTKPADIPPGSPIGSAAREECWFCDL